MSGFSYDELENPAPIETQCHSDVNLVSPLRNLLRENTIGANSGKFDTEPAILQLVTFHFSSFQVPHFNIKSKPSTRGNKGGSISGPNFSAFRVLLLLSDSGVSAFRFQLSSGLRTPSPGVFSTWV